MTAGSQSDLLPSSQVAELINGLVKALRAFHMYLPNNPIYQRATDNLRAAFSPIWAVLDELVLTVAETDFVWEDQVVYHQLNKADSLAWGCSRTGCARSRSGVAPSRRSCRGCSRPSIARAICRPTRATIS